MLVCDFCDLFSIESVFAVSVSGVDIIRNNFVLSICIDILIIFFWLFEQVGDIYDEGVAANLEQVCLCTRFLNVYYPFFDRLTQ